MLKVNVGNLGAYDGNANGDLTIDASTGNPVFALRTDLTNVRALPLLRSMADFDKLDGRMQAKISVRSTGNSQRAIVANMSGTVFAIFQDGAIRGLNVAQMIRSLTSSPLSGWQAGEALSTDLTQLSASFKIDKGQAQTTDLNLVGPLVRMTGAGTIDLGTRQIGFRVEPKLVMTTEGQGRAGDPVGFGIPVMIEGPWTEPRIYPDMQGILDNPDAAYARLKELGKGLFGPDGAGLGGLGGLLGGAQGGTGTPGGNTTQGGSANGQTGDSRRPARRDHRQPLAARAERRLWPERRGATEPTRKPTPKPRPQPFPARSRCPAGPARARAERAGRAAGQSANERRAAAAVQPLTGQNAANHVGDPTANPLHFVLKRALSVAVPSKEFCPARNFAAARQRMRIPCF